jgi:hypothetical protein
MRLTRLLFVAAPFFAAACSNPVAPATDCVYDKTASSAPGNQVCTPTSVVTSVTTGSMVGPGITVVSTP